MIKIRNSHRLLVNEPLKNRAELHVSKMKDVATYAAYQSLVTTLNELLSPFGVAINNCKLGGTDRTKIKNKIQSDVLNALNSLSRKVEGDANDMSQEEGEAFVKDAGFDLVEAKSVAAKKVLTFLDVPANFTAMDSKKQGSVHFNCDADDDTDDYLIERQIKDDHWDVVGHANVLPVIFDGFPSKANSTFRMRGLRKGTLMSDCTEPVTVWVT